MRDAIAYGYLPCQKSTQLLAGSNFSLTHKEIQVVCGQLLITHFRVVGMDDASGISEIKLVHRP